MSFCNRCHADLAEGRPVYRGKLTPATWCESCAAELFAVPVTSMGGQVTVESLAGAFPEFASAMAALKARAAMKDTRDWAKAASGDVE